MAVYTEDFFADQADGSRRSAAAVLPLVREIVGEVGSVLDVGCGVGTWLAEWLRLGVPVVVGYDGDYVDRSRLQVPPEAFVPVDLADPASVPRCEVDLVMSVEVAEHLDESQAEAFVDLLVRSSDLLLFSAAIPQQGGTHHVNERWPSYWHAKLHARGFEAFDLLRPRIWGDEAVEWWYRQNLLLYARGARADRLRQSPQPAPPLDVVHPDAWFAGLAASRERAPAAADRAEPTAAAPAVETPVTLRRIVQELPRATRAAVAHRVAPAALRSRSGRYPRP
jgi:SAM-dependent methyltransferase